MTDQPSLTSSWGSTTGWLTPSYLFLLLNLVIGTIVLTSRFGSKNRTQHEQETRPLARAPSFLDRIKSINLSLYNFPPPNPLTEPTPDFIAGIDPPVQLERAPSFIERVKSINLSSFYRSEVETGSSDPHEDIGHDEAQHQVKRSKSEPRVVTKEAEGTLKKSVSERTVSVEEEEDRESVERRRSATTRLEKTESFGDEGVDAKADDFINKFKQQLRLQRLESLLRYREMLQGK